MGARSWKRGDKENKHPLKKTCPKKKLKKKKTTLLPPLDPRRRHVFFHEFLRSCPPDKVRTPTQSGVRYLKYRNLNHFENPSSFLLKNSRKNLLLHFLFLYTSMSSTSCVGPSHHRTELIPSILLAGGKIAYFSIIFLLSFYVLRSPSFYAGSKECLYCINFPAADLFSKI